MKIPFPRFQKAFNNPTLRTAIENTTANEPISACTCDHNKELTHISSIEPTNGPEYHTISRSTKILNLALYVANSMKPDATQERHLTKRAFPPQYFTAALAAVSPDAEAIAKIDIKSGKGARLLRTPQTLRLHKVLEQII